MHKVSFSILVLLFSISSLHADVAEDLRLHWQDDSESIVSADLRMRVMRSRALSGKTISDFDRIVDQLGANPSPKKIGAALKPLVDRGQKEIWGLVDWTIDGDKVRETIQSEGEPVATTVFDGQQHIDVMHDNDQINIGNPNPTRTIPLKSLYFVPAQDLEVNNVSETEASVAFESSEGKIVAIKTGFVESVKSGSKRIHQYGPVEHPGGIEFPSAAIRVQVKQDGTIGRVFAYVVDSASFNQTIDEQKFVVSGEVDDKIFDYRDDPANPVGQHLSYGLEDVTKFEPQTELDPRSSLAKGIGHYIPGLLVTCFIGIMVVRFRMS